MKMIVMTLVCATTFVALSEEEFDCTKWNRIRMNAKEQAEREFSKEFVFEAPNWEQGKGVGFFMRNANGRLNRDRYYMKFDAEGRLVKVAPMDDFPELVRLKDRVAELTDQLKAEYAKSLGKTVEECENINKATFLSRMFERAETPQEKTAKERVVLQPKVEEFLGFKFGQAPLKDVVLKERYAGDDEQYQEIKLEKPYRYFKDATLFFKENKLIHVRYSVQFAADISIDAIESELAECSKDIATKLGIVLNPSDSSIWQQTGDFSFRTFTSGRDSHELIFSVVDRQAEKEVESITRKRGRELPGF